MPETITDHSKDSQLGTPDIPASAAVFTIHATTRISAPAALVFRTLRNTDTWRDWNKFCPRVTLSYQPPEDEDEATLAEVHELVRNTSVAGSVDSAITDGAASSGGGLIGRRMSVEEEEGIRLSPPPVTRERLRASIASQGGKGRLSTSSGRPHSANGIEDDNSPSAMAARAVANVNAQNAHKTSQSSTSQANGATPKSAVVKFQETQEARKASGTASETPDASKGVIVESPQNPNVLVTAPRTAASEQALKAQKRRASTSSASKKARMSINALYGEPSVRIQMGTRMTLALKVRILNTSLATDREMSVEVTEVSRPEDNEESLAAPHTTDIASIAQRMSLNTSDDNLTEEGLKHVSRMQTHLPAKQPGVYRIVWSMSTSYSPPRSYPKWLLQAQRVHEIRKVVRGDGREECIYEDWECWRGMMANRQAKKYQKYWEERAKQWGLGLGSYAEAMGGDVERRDFVGTQY